MTASQSLQRILILFFPPSHPCFATLLAWLLSFLGPGTLLAGIMQYRTNSTIMATKMIIINLEQGMPTVEQASHRLIGELIRARAQGAKVVKLIHGYGSSGVGGKLRIGIRATLADRKRRGEIKEAVPGEDWSIFDEGARRILDAYPDLNRDRDFGRGNAGITILLL